MRKLFEYLTEITEQPIDVEFKVWNHQNLIIIKQKLSFNEVMLQIHHCEFRNCKHQQN